MRAEFSLSEAVLGYRDQYIVERGCGRLKARPLSLRPMYLERDDHATGLIRLLTIGLRVLTLLEFSVRKRLAEEGTELAGLYASNPKRSTARPSAELLLEAFNGIDLVVIQAPHRRLRHLTPLTQPQNRILNLSGSRLRSTRALVLNLLNHPRNERTESSLFFLYLNTIFIGLSVQPGWTL